MSETTNISAISLQSVDPNRHFNNFFSKPIVLTSNENDVINSYFQSVTENAQAAKILSSAIIYTCQQENIDPMKVIDQLRALKGLALNRALALFLNQFRYGSSLLGTNTATQSNKYITRSIVF